MSKKKQKELMPPTVASAGDCTGLMAALPESAQQAEALEEMYPTHWPKERDKRKQ